jgi:type IV pilus assembly protein PilC
MAIDFPARAGAPAAAAPKRRRAKVPGARKIRLKELPMFTRMIAAMLDSGIPLVQTLGALEEQTENKAFKPVIAGLRSRIEGGADFSHALREYPEVFDVLYVSMVSAGEAGGMLAEIMRRLAKYLESSARLRSKVKSAMMYPLVVMCLALIIAASMIIWLVPVFQDIYDDFGSDLPGPTMFLVNTSNFIRGNALLVIAGVAGLIFAFNAFGKTEKGAILLDNLKLHFPLVGELVLKISLSRFSSTFAQLIHSGVPILNALDIVAFAMGNKVLERIILRAKITVGGGELLSVALAKHAVFPRVLVRMLAAGEKTGKMDEMLQKVSDFYEDEVEAALNGLTSIIEPLLMVFLGIVVGGIVLGMFMPIFKMSEILDF